MKEVEKCFTIILKPSSDELFYYTSVLNKYNIPRSEFMDSVYELYKQFDNLRELFIEEGLEPWTSCEFDFTRDGKLNVSLIILIG